MPFSTALRQALKQGCSNQIYTAATKLPPNLQYQAALLLPQAFPTQPSIIDTLIYIPDFTHTYHSSSPTVISAVPYFSTLLTKVCTLPCSHPATPTKDFRQRVQRQLYAALTVQKNFVRTHCGAESCTYLSRARQAHTPGTIPAVAAPVKTPGARPDVSQLLKNQRFVFFL